VAARRRGSSPGGRAGPFCRRSSWWPPIVVASRQPNPTGGPAVAARAGRCATRSGALRSAFRAPSYTTTRDVTPASLTSLAHHHLRRRAQALKAPMLIDGTINGERYLAYARQLLVPLRP